MWLVIITIDQCYKIRSWGAVTNFCAIVSVLGSFLLLACKSDNYQVVTTIFDSRKSKMYLALWGTRQSTQRQPEVDILLYVQF